MFRVTKAENYFWRHRHQIEGGEERRGVPDCRDGHTLSLLVSRVNTVNQVFLVGICCKRASNKPIVVLYPISLRHITKREVW